MNRDDNNEIPDHLLPDNQQTLGESEEFQITAEVAEVNEHTVELDINWQHAARFLPQRYRTAMENGHELVIHPLLGVSRCENCEADIEQMQNTTCPNQPD